MVADIGSYARRWVGEPYSWSAPDGDDSDCADFVNAVLAHYADGD